MTTFTGHLTDGQAQRLLDGLLAPSETAEVETHAAGCLECQALVASFRALSEALDGLELPPLPDDFTEGVLARIETRQRTAARERRLAFGIAATALAAVAAVVVLTVGQWAPGLAGAVDSLGSAGRALRLGADIAGPVVSALRLYLGVAAAAAAVPVLYLLSRLMPVQTAQTAQIA